MRHWRSAAGSRGAAVLIALLLWVASAPLASCGGGAGGGVEEAAGDCAARGVRNEGCGGDGDDDDGAEEDGVIESFLQVGPNHAEPVAEAATAGAPDPKARPKRKRMRKAGSGSSSGNPPTRGASDANTDASAAPSSPVGAAAAESNPCPDKRHPRYERHAGEVGASDVCVAPTPSPAAGARGAAVSWACPLGCRPAPATTTAASPAAVCVLSSERRAAPALCHLPLPGDRDPVSLPRGTAKANADAAGESDQGPGRSGSRRRRRRGGALPKRLPWPCHTIPRETLASIRDGNFTPLVAAAAARGRRALLFETLLTTRPASNDIERGLANVPRAYLSAFDWVQHGDEFMCRADKKDKVRRQANCTGWARVTSSPPWTVVSSGSTVGTRVLETELARFRHVYDAGRPAGAPAPPGSEWRTWVVAGGDVPEGLLTEHGQRILRSGYFGRVLIEGLAPPLDAIVDGVGVAPIGLTEMYMSRLEPAFVAAQAARADRLLAAPGGKRGVFAAWGAYYGHLDQYIPSRRDADAWLRRTSVAKRELVGQGVYFERLAESRFSVCPAGRGAQSPKIVEAVLMNAVPIVPREPVFVALERVGFPVVTVASWGEVDDAAAREAWWRDRSPALGAARWLLVGDVWASFVAHPCPGTVAQFVSALKAGVCPSVACARSSRKP